MNKDALKNENKQNDRKPKEYEEIVNEDKKIVYDNEKALKLYASIPFILLPKASQFSHPHLLF